MPFKSMAWAKRQEHLRANTESYDRSDWNKIDSVQATQGLNNNYMLHFLFGSFKAMQGNC